MRFPPASRPRPSAFSLIELLVTIVVIATLIGLALPSIAGVKRNAGLAKEGNMARQLSLALTLYQSDHNDRFPFFGVPGEPLEYLNIDGVELKGGTSYPAHFFTHHRWYWASAIYPDYLDVHRADIEPEWRREFYETLDWPERVISVNFQMTATAFARPEFWTEDDPFGIDAHTETYLLKHTTLADVRFPGQKGILGHNLFSSAGLPATREMTLAMGDGSVRWIDWLNELDLPGKSVKRPWGATGFNVDCTVDGLAGIDF